jgi:hypothetical protein
MIDDKLTAKVVLAKAERLRASNAEAVLMGCDRKLAGRLMLFLFMVSPFRVSKI